VELLDKELKDKVESFRASYKENINKFFLHEALSNVWEIITTGDKYMNEKAPWKSVKNNPEEFLKVMTNLMGILYTVGWDLKPFMPETADKIFASLGVENIHDPLENYHFRIKKGTGLFPRLT